MGLIGACSGAKGGQQVQGGMSDFVFGMSGSSWGHNEEHC